MPDPTPKDIYETYREEIRKMVREEINRIIPTVVAEIGKELRPLIRKERKTG